MDKVTKIYREIERLRLKVMGVKTDFAAGQKAVLTELLGFIEESQKEPLKIKKGCKYRSICNVTNNDTGSISFVAGKIYVAPEDDTLVSEENGWLCDLSENASNFELVEEPASEDLEEAIGEYCSNPENFITYIDVGFKQSPIKKDDIPLIIEAIKFGANWQKEQMMSNAVGGHATFEFYGFEGKTYGTIAHDPICLDDLGLKDTDKCKLIITKED